MALYLSEEELSNLIGIDEAVDIVEASVRDEGLGEAENRPRQRVDVGDVRLHVMTAGMRSAGVLGLKSFTTGPHGARALTLLFDHRGEPLCILEANGLGMLRTGAASGVATRHLARADAHVVSMLGCGRQAQTQLLAVCAVRPVDEVVVWSRTRSRAADFCRHMQERIDARFVVEDTAEKATERADVVVTTTPSQEPVLMGEMLASGAHVNAVGSNKPTHCEVSPGVFERSAAVVVDDVTQAKVESGDLIRAVDEGKLSWMDVVGLAEVVSGQVPGRSADDEVTVFESHGIGLWDVAIGVRAYEKASRQGLGLRIG